jgi:hypothetical protein
VRLASSLAIVSISLILIGCAGSTATQSDAPRPTQAVSVTPPPDAAAAVDAALHEAATHLGVATTQLQVTQVESREWPDASLGCPQPDQLYSQVVTPGYLVMIASGSHQLEYHADTRGRVTLCHET